MKRFNLVDWSQDHKFIEDNENELSILEFDNMEDAQKWCNFLNQI